MRCTRVLVLLVAVAGCGQPPAPAAVLKAPFSVVEASIADMQAAMREGRITSREIVTQYLTRIATYEDGINAVIQVNPKALDEADVRDRERAQGKVRGPLHGIPVALKDNVNTSFMPTTGGALAFDGLVPPYDATLTKNLLDAGAIIIAKTMMTELANWVANGMPGNFNGLKGYGLNPYDPRRDPRGPAEVKTGRPAASGRAGGGPGAGPTRFDDGRPVLGTGGSSSGTGTAANFWAANVGTETSGSILSPSNQNMLVGIKPTVGRISRYGVIPITADQDTAGPMARTVADAALMLGALESAAPDPNDPATTVCQVPPNRDYTPHLKADALKGARIGIPKAFFFDPVTLRGEKEPRGGLNPAQRTAMGQALAVLKQAGAEIVEADIPSIVDPDSKNNFLLWGTCAGPSDVRGKDANCSSALKYGMKRDFNAYLASLGDRAPVKTLTELRRWNLAHANMGAIKYGQAQLDVSDEVDLERDRAKWEADRKKDIQLGATHGIDEMLKAHKLDAILFPGASGAGIAAKPGYPTVIVPFATVPNAPPNSTFPQGFDPKPAPYGVSFSGTACSEPRLIELAYAFEQLTKKRMPPASTP
ncbi:MAG TPA: amidase family protein [Vicinamibacterales bacterium]|nr:amidase family protein [Vicinamibacterales bacterium]